VASTFLARSRVPANAAHVGGVTLLVDEHLSPRLLRMVAVGDPDSAHVLTAEQDRAIQFETDKGTSKLMLSLTEHAVSRAWYHTAAGARYGRRG